MFGGTLHVLHVVDNVNARLTYAEAPLLGPPVELQAELERTGHEKLEASLTERDRRELRAVPVMRIGNSTAKEITEYAREAAVDLIVVGATGRGAVDRMLMGSVADKVIRRAPCPVLAVRHPEHEFVLPDVLRVAAHENA
jgi:nucleotide-binding universal stress UspA family protein